MTTKQSAENRKIASLARQYGNEGYEVLFQPLIPNMRSEAYRPDLLVRKGADVIIIEVVSGKTTKEKQDAIEYFAQYAKENKGLRFDLIVTNKRKTRPQKQSRDSKLLKLLHEHAVRDIDATVHSSPAAAVVLCALLIESLLKALTDDESGLIGRELPVNELAHLLQKRNIISKSAENFAAYVWKIRNGVVHASAHQDWGAIALDISKKTKSLLRNYRSGTGL